MKTMTIRLVALTLALLTALPLLAACGKGNVKVSDNTTAIPYVNDNGYSTRPTVYVPENQLTMMTVMMLVRPNMKWSAVSGYEHTVIEENKAEFCVADGTGFEATMTVDYDPQNDRVEKVILTFRDVSADITNNGEGFVEFFKIVNAMMAAYEE